MHYFKDLHGKPHVLDSLDFTFLLPEGCVEITYEEFTALATPSPTKAARLSELTSQYKADIADLNLAYLAALAADGANETVRTTAVRQQLTDRTTKYNADRQAIITGA